MEQDEQNGCKMNARNAQKLEQEYNRRLRTKPTQLLKISETNLHNFEKSSPTYEQNVSIHKADHRINHCNASACLLARNLGHVAFSQSVYRPLKHSAT